MSIRSILLVVLIIIAGALAFDTVYVVNERERAILLQFGAVQKGDIEPGIHIKIPLAEVVMRFDGRIQTLDTPVQRYYTVEQKPLMVDLFVKYRIGEVERYYTATSGEESRARSVVEDRTNEGLRNQIGRRTMHDVVSGERDQLMTELTASLNELTATDLGIEVIDVRVKRIDLPDEVSDKVFERMASEREILARQYRATGQEIAIGIRADADRQAIVIEAEAYKTAEQVRGDGDAKSANIYAAAYGQDADFYEFYRTVNAYAKIFSKGGSLLVIDPGSQEFFEYFKTQNGSR